ncbi:MAG TPA: translation initiation factor IF-3 [Candidatus Sumerlaeota bacterium]|nr:translation initiation factor IF-3 [Candidatus Sumerlaeota bacterium]HMZ51365.1 translation initiation factor IF-3 [Candidatus Sumerlaeota bacterium]
MNHQIRVKEVRLIDSNGEQVGIVPIEEALRKAEAQQLDLVEVSPDAVPPVCKIYDYKKVLYERKKKLKESKKKATTIHLKEVKMRVAIDSHDRDFKLKHAREFLEKGDKVKFTVIFRGREVTKPEMGDKLVEAIREGLKDIGELESPVARMGKQISLVMGRRKDWNPRKQAPKAPAPAPAKTN